MSGEASPSSMPAKVFLVALMALCLAGAAGAARTGAPLLTAHKYYTFSSGSATVDFVTHSGTVIDAGPTGRVAGSQYDISDVSVSCPAVAAKATVSGGPPMLTLELANGKYSFHKEYKLTNTIVSTPPGPNPVSKTVPSIEITISGTVTGPTTVSGTVQVSGAPCTSKPISYTAKLNPSQSKYVSPDA